RSLRQTQRPRHRWRGSVCRTRSQPLKRSARVRVTSRDELPPVMHTRVAAPTIIAPMAVVAVMPAIVAVIAVSVVAVWPAKAKQRIDTDSHRGGRVVDPLLRLRVVIPRCRRVLLLDHLF